jgi:hypothetical protein
MSKYIAKQKAISALINEANTHNNPVKRAYTRAAAIIEQITAEDVQPVNRWISVDDRLPESEKEVLVWYRYTWGDAPTSYGFGINRWYSDTKRWREGCLLKGVEVLFWQPLPEPPKDGEKE